MPLTLLKKLPKLLTVCTIRLQPPQTQCMFLSIKLFLRTKPSQYFSQHQKRIQSFLRHPFPFLVLLRHVIDRACEA